MVLLSVLLIIAGVLMIGASICQIATAKAKYKYKDEDPSFRYSEEGSCIAQTKYLLGECVRS